jgi:hypothetical protein
MYLPGVSHWQALLPSSDCTKRGRQRSARQRCANQACCWHPPPYSTSAIVTFAGDWGGGIFGRGCRRLMHIWRTPVCPFCFDFLSVYSYNILDWALWKRKPCNWRIFPHQEIAYPPASMGRDVLRWLLWALRAIPFK